MKILFVSIYYPRFLQSFYKSHPGTEPLSYDDHQRRLLAELFGDADFYSDGVKANGHEAVDIVANDELLQKKWANEQGMKIDSSVTEKLSKIKYVRIFIKPNWLYKILEAQIEKYGPDVIYFHDIDYFSPFFLDKLKKRYTLVAQKASPLSKIWCYERAKVVFTSFPHFVPLFARYKIAAEYLKLAFGEKVLQVVPEQSKKYTCTFVGGLSRQHARGTELLEEVAKKVDLDVFGYGKDILDPSSPLYLRHHGEVWGKEMYTTMRQSRMTINRHIDVAEQYANNMRLYEATGSGTLLLTDEKVNLSELFEPNKEIVTYKNAEDLAKKIAYFTTHPEEVEKIAQAGQKRTLQEHNFRVRMGEMLGKLERYL
jgi:spore maturation protein CgeB